MRLHKLLLFIFNCCIVVPLDCSLSSNSLAQASDFSVSREGKIIFSGQDNRMAGFGLFEDGFCLRDDTTTVSFDSVFPISGDVDLRGGSVYLLKDLSLTNSLMFTSAGTIFGQGRSLSFPCTKDVLFVPHIADPGVKMFNHQEMVETNIGIRSIDWSYDGKYLAVGTQYDYFDREELKIFYFDGNVLTLTASANVNNNSFIDVTSVRWHPSEYYLALARLSGSGDEVRIFNFDVSSGSLMQTDGVNTGSRSAFAVAWSPQGDYLAAGFQSSNAELALYSFTNGSITQVDTFNVSSSRSVQPDALSWDPSGNYFAVGYNSVPNRDELAVYRFNGTTITQANSFNVAHTVRSLDWSPSGTYLAVGLGSGPSDRLHVYSYDTQLGTLNFNTSVDTNAKPVFSTAWDATGGCLAIGCGMNHDAQIRLYSFDDSSEQLSLLDDVGSSAGVYRLRWSPDNLYLGAGIFSPEFFDQFYFFYSPPSGSISVYKFFDYTTSTSFCFDTTKLIFNSDVVFTDTVQFKGCCAIDGKGNILDMSCLGHLEVTHGSTLLLRNVLLRGFGARDNQLILASDSEVRLSNVAIEFVDDVTTYSGGIYVEGPSMMILKEYNWTIDSGASLTVDGVTLWQDSAGQEDPQGDVVGDNLSMVHSGTIKRLGKDFNIISLIMNNSQALVSLRDDLEEKCDLIEENSQAVVAHDDVLNLLLSFDFGDIVLEESEITFTHNIYLSPEHTITITQDTRLSGSSHFIHFAATDQPLIFVDQNVTLTLRDILLSDFVPNNIALSPGARLVFGDNTFVHLRPGCTKKLNYDWYFSGMSILHGSGGLLDLGVAGNVVVLPQGSMTIHDLCVSNVKDTKIRVIGDQASIRLCSATMLLADDYVFANGSLLFEREVTVAGPYTFAYQSTMASTIRDQATLLVTGGVTFKYDVPRAANDLLVMESQHATLAFDTATLHATTTGICLQAGSLVIDNAVTFSSEGSNPSEAICLGGPAPEQELALTLLAAADLNVYGPLEYRNGC